MADNNNDYNQPHSNSHVQDAQGLQSKLLSSTQMLTEEEAEQQRKIKKMSWKSKTTTFETKMSSTWFKCKSNKRKRDLSSKQDLLKSSIKSISQLSISQRVSKKMKNSTEETMP